MIIRHLGLQPYQSTWDNMKRFTIERDEKTVDELWLLEHPPVYTQGQAGKAEHILNPSTIPIVQTDRGGQVTYHGPGQLVAYVLMNINKRHLAIRTLVCQLEDVLIALLNEMNISASTRCGAPGVYVDERKIASIGLRVKNGCTYHGIALNVSMDLNPFYGINPCGFAQLKMTQLSEFIANADVNQVSQDFIRHFLHVFRD
ncbi:lipoyl(octanoyl) transferase LipB [bacterium]|nr:lipoyl(octanoyl) transferase LipB [bacterium]